MSDVATYDLGERNAGLAASRRFIALSVFSAIVCFAGSWVDFKLTHLVVWTILLFATLRKSIDAKRLILVFLLVGPIISNRFGTKLGPLPDMTFDRLLAGLALLAELSNPWTKGRKWITNVLDRKILFLIIVGAVSIAFCFMKKTPIRVLIDSLLIPYVLYLMAKRYAHDEWFLHTVYHIFLIDIVILGLLALGERFTHRDLLIVDNGDDKFAEGRVNGPFAYAEELGGVMNTLILVAASVGGTFQDGKGWRRMRVGAMILGIWAVLNTLTRGVWIALAVAFLAMLGLNIKKSVPVVIALILVILLIAPLAPLLLNRDSKLFTNRIDKMETIYARLATYHSALVMFADHPLIGVGYGAYAEAYERDLDRYVSFYKNVISVPTPHDAYLAALSETGIIGFLFFIALFVTVFRYAFQVRKYDTNRIHVAFANAAICFTLAYLVVDFGLDFTRNLAYINKLLFFLFGILSGFVQALQDRAHAEQEYRP